MKKLLIVAYIVCAFLVSFTPHDVRAKSSVPTSSSQEVLVIDMDMMILPGTQSYLEKSIEEAEEKNAALLIIRLNTPGGMLQTSQKMIQSIFQSKVPVVIYVSPSGATATSAGVFITMAAHVAVMAPGTSIGAAHPVAGDGKDIEGDMRKKAENMATKMVESITALRGRNVEWVEEAVRKSSSLTADEALEKGVVDYVASDVTDLLKQLSGKEIQLDKDTKLAGRDFTALPRRTLEMSLTDSVINVLANPNIAALLWLAATTGISLELYNPGAILPGVVGVICLILALAVSQVIPITQGGIALIVVGGLLVGAELYIGSGILGAGGLIAMVLGTIYLIDVQEAPSMAVDLELMIPVALVLGGFFLYVAFQAAKARKQKNLTGNESLIGRIATAETTIAESGKVFIEGEIWNATAEDGLISKGDRVQITEVKGGLTLVVKKCED